MAYCNLEDVKLNDLVRYRHCMSCRNMYGIVTKLTNAYIVLEDGIKFKKKDGWGTGSKSRYHVNGINDHKEHYEDDIADMYYY